jgi:site-specific DNA-methyltransferase (adenine-specific)
MLIENSSNDNDIVLDIFMGSGTTAVACQETNRQYIGFEIEPKWVKVANDRLNKVDASGQQCMFLR